MCSHWSLGFIPRLVSVENSLQTLNCNQTKSVYIWSSLYSIDATIYAPFLYEPRTHGINPWWTHGMNHWYGPIMVPCYEPLAWTHDESMVWILGINPWYEPMMDSWYEWTLGINLWWTYGINSQRAQKLVCIF